MKRIKLALKLAVLLTLAPAVSHAQSFNYKCGDHRLTINLAPNSARLDGKAFEYKDGDSDGVSTNMTFYGDGDVLKFLAVPANDTYKMGLTSGGNFEQSDCMES
ncbi:hypothetical protein SC206_02165 [Rouxiella sp. T17]|uniref:hypothetical protein n=1 Tax=Rouxiella sp. T17 TaxID=3085684 RepID=UPI002FCCAC81